MPAPSPPQRVVSAVELAAQHSRPHAPLSARDLERWLVIRHLATVHDDGLLHPISLGLELSAGVGGDPVA
jgi:hypothetical protein